MIKPLKFIVLVAALAGFAFSSFAGNIVMGGSDILTVLTLLLTK